MSRSTATAAANPKLLKFAESTPGQRLERLSAIVDNYALDGLFHFMRATDEFHDDWGALLEQFRRKDEGDGQTAFSNLMKMLDGNKKARGLLFKIDSDHGVDLCASEEAAFALGFQVARRLTGNGGVR